MFIENLSRDIELVDVSGKVRGEENFRNKSRGGISI